MIIRPYLLCVLSISLLSCAPEEAANTKGGLCPENEETYSKLPNQSQEFSLNLSVFLDLSDRIDSQKYPDGTMEFYKRDLGYLKSLSHAFARHCRARKFQQLNERFQIFFHPAPSSREVNELASNLNLALTKDNANKELICNLVDTYVSNTHAIYTEAMAEGKFPGSDIWSFFENKAKRDCVKPNARNILVILTDGYMYHEDTKRISPDNAFQFSYLVPGKVKKLGLMDENWMSVMESKKIGFLPTSTHMDNLEVMVLGLNPSKNNSSYEPAILKKFWSDWFDAIGVKKYRIELNDLPSDLDEYIQNFVLGVE